MKLFSFPLVDTRPFQVHNDKNRVFILWNSQHNHPLFLHPTIALSRCLIVHTVNRCHGITIHQCVHMTGSDTNLINGMAVWRITYLKI